MSLGSPLYTEELADAIAYATEHGNTIVVASGNDRMVSRFVVTRRQTRIRLGERDGTYPRVATRPT